MIEIDLKACCKKCDYSRIEIETVTDKDWNGACDVYIICLNKPICKERAEEIEEILGE